MRRIIELMLVAGIASGIFAAEPTPSPSAAPPLDVRAYVDRGVQFFRAQAASNEDGWLFHPMGGSRVIGWKTNILHFSIIEVTIPGYRYENPYEVLVPSTTPGEPMQRVTRYRTVVRDPTRDYKEKKQAYDPNGPIERNCPTAIYEKDAAFRWRYGGLGNNALAILALRRCGVRADDPLLTQTVSNLLRLINEFGLPDNLHDLAWLTAGFAVLPGEDCKQLTERCAAKLLDTQITTGPAAGLWGPVAVNTPMAAALLKTLNNLGEQKKALQKELTEERAKKVKDKPTAKVARMEEQMERIASQLIEVQDSSARITQLGMLMFDIFGSMSYGMDGWGRRTLTFQADRLAIETLPYLIQNQISADLDSTALALFALRMAFENNRLPAKTWRPEPAKSAATPGAPPPSMLTFFPPPRDTRDVIGLAAKALLTARPANGQWPEVNLHQRVTDYTWLKSIPQLVISNAPFRLPQPVTLVSVCRGAAALANLQMIQTGKNGPTPLEIDTFHPLVDDLTTGKLVLTNTDIRLPYDTLLQMTAIRSKSGKPVRADYTAWNQMADWVTSQQNTNGYWGRTNMWVMLPSTSLRALLQVLPVINDADIIKMYDKPHLTPAMFFKGNLFRYSAPEASYFTAAALLFLADGLPEDWTPSVPTLDPVPPPAPTP